MLVDYAADCPPGASDRLLRRIVGWVAIVYGGLSLMRSVSHFALVVGWAARAQFPRWAPLDTLEKWVFVAVDATIMAALLLGGVMLLRRMPTSIILLRVAAVCSIAFNFTYAAIFVMTYEGWMAFLSTPVAALFDKLPLIAPGWVPVILLVLTLPSLAKRIV